jgi:hypothetical protein
MDGERRWRGAPAGFPPSSASPNNCAQGKCGWAVRALACGRREPSVRPPPSRGASVSLPHPFASGAQEIEQLSVLHRFLL